MYPLNRMRSHRRHLRLDEMMKDADPHYFDFDVDDDVNCEISRLTRSTWRSPVDYSCRRSLPLHGDGGAGRGLLVGVTSASGISRHAWSLWKKCSTLRTMSRLRENQAFHHFLEFLFWRSVILLQSGDNWRKVTAIADALLDKKTLTGKECEGVARAIVDAPIEIKAEKV